MKNIHYLIMAVCLFFGSCQTNEKPNKWYEKGYLGKDFLSITGTEVQALFDSNQYGVIADQVNSTYSRLGEANTPFTLTNFPYMRKEADSVGGTVECCATGLPVGLGGPLFEGLESDLAAAVFAIPAVKGVEFGSGFAAAF